MTSYGIGSMTQNITKNEMFLLYCRVPARWALQQTTRAPDSDKTRRQGSFGPLEMNSNIATVAVHQW